MRELLVTLGLDKEVIDKVMARYGQEIGGREDTISALTAERDGLANQATTHAEQLESLKTANNDDYETRIEALKAENSQALEALKRDNETDLKIYKAKARNIKAVRANLDLDGDIDAQLKELKEKEPYLFGTDTKDVGATVIFPDNGTTEQQTAYEPFEEVRKRYIK